MKTKITVLFLGAVLASPMALASSTDTGMDTPAERCQNIADYSRSVAKMRDEGWRLKEIQEINAERAGPGLVDAYDLAAKIVYQHSEVPPEKVRSEMLKGCMFEVEKAAKP